MKSKKKILSLITGSLILINSNGVVFGDIVADNSSYYKSTGYSINTYNNVSKSNVSSNSNITTTKSNVIDKSNVITTNSNITSSTIKTSNNISSNSNVISANVITTNSNVVSSNINYIKSYSPYEYNANSYVITKVKPIVTTTSEETTETTVATTPDKEEENIPNSEISTTEETLLRLINEARLKEGLQPLKLDPELSQIARYKSQDMYDNNYFSHTSPSFGSTFTLIKKEGIKYYLSGENIGKTYSVYRAHTGFMNSSGHRANIMNPKFNYVGIGIVGNYYTEIFIQK